MARKLTSEDVLERLSDLFVRRGVPDDIRSDNGPEFTTQRVVEWLERVDVKTLFIEPGSPWENGYNESCNGTLRYELLDVELFDTLLEAKVLIERWRVQYSTIRPHSSLGYRPPVPESIRLVQTYGSWNLLWSLRPGRIYIYGIAVFPAIGAITVDAMHIRVRIPAHPI